MMRFSLLILTIISCLGIALGQTEAQRQPTVEVNGSAEIFVQPDYVMVSLDVTKTNKELQIAKKDVDTTVSQVLELAKQYQIKPENVRMPSISVSMKYNSVRDPQKRIFDEDDNEVGTKIFVGYEVSTEVSIKITNLSQFQDFLDEVLKTGISGVGKVSFESSELRKYKDQARDMAMKAALEKGTAMTAAINQKLGKAIFIKEGKLNDSYLRTMSGGVLNANATSFKPSSTTKESFATFSPGAIGITAEVSVIFLLN